MRIVSSIFPAVDYCDERLFRAFKETLTELSRQKNRLPILCHSRRTGLLSVPSRNGGGVKSVKPESNSL